MNYLGRLPVQTNLHLVITPQEQNALVNALSFFWAYFSESKTIDLRAWQDCAHDEPLALYDQLATKLARLK